MADIETLQQDLHRRPALGALPRLRPHAREIAGWIGFTDAERARIMAELPRTRLGIALRTNAPARS